jgi:hypothetical protein
MRMLYSRQQHLDCLYIFNVFEWKINCLSFMDTVIRRVLTKSVNEFSVFTVSNIVMSSPSTT